MIRKSLFLAVVIISMLLMSVIIYDHSGSKVKIKGFNLVAPPKPLSAEDLAEIASVGAEWVSVIPYAFCDPENTKVIFGKGKQWWGESPKGVVETIKLAKSKQLKVMLKPHLWVRGQGWAGDLDYSSSELWEEWEEAYTNYLFTYVEIAQSNNVEMLCIGTEIRNSTKNRPDFWFDMIDSIRSVYKGKITYAANWDEYEHVDFWGHLDYIGIDAYFPLSHSKTPNVEELKENWDQPMQNMAAISSKFNKSVIFTEYGYESIDYNTIGHWNIDKDSLDVNYQAQENAFLALHDRFSYIDWWAGGFIWKWHFHANEQRNQRLMKTFTPQSKPAMEVIKDHFKNSTK